MCNMHILLVMPLLIAHIGMKRTTTPCRHFPIKLVMTLLLIQIDLECKPTIISCRNMNMKPSQSSFTYSINISRKYMYFKSSTY